MRVFVLAVVFLIAVAATASAQQPQPTNTSVTPSTNVFSKTAIDRVVARTISATPTTAVAPAKAAPVPRMSKSFWKTPWPYIIGGAAAAILIIALNSGNNGSGTTPY